MKEEANAEYMTVLNALGSHIANNKNELVFARYEIERLEKLLAEANEKIKGDNNAK